MLALDAVRKQRDALAAEVAMRLRALSGGQLTAAQRSLVVIATSLVSDSADASG